jgi:hypothetical protein
VFFGATLEPIMSQIFKPLSAAVILVVSLQGYAADLVAAQELQAIDTPINQPPMGCRFPEMIILDYVPPRHTVSQKLALAPPPFNAVADAPLGPRRTVRFDYHFSGLQDVLQPNTAGSFKISSTEVTVFEGTSFSARKASVAKFLNHSGKVDVSASLTKSSLEHRPFQDQWLIRVTSKGMLHDAQNQVRPATVTFLCDMPINDTPSPSPSPSPTPTPVPTLTQ